MSSSSGQPVPAGLARQPPSAVPAVGPSWSQPRPRQSSRSPCGSGTAHGGSRFAPLPRYSHSYRQPGSPDPSRFRRGQRKRTSPVKLSIASGGETMHSHRTPTPRHPQHAPRRRPPARTRPGREGWRRSSPSREGDSTQSTACYGRPEPPRHEKRRRTRGARGSPAPTKVKKKRPRMMTTNELVVEFGRAAPAPSPPPPGRHAPARNLRSTACAIIVVRGEGVKDGICPRAPGLATNRRPALTGRAFRQTRTAMERTWLEDRSSSRFLHRPALPVKRGAMEVPPQHDFKMKSGRRNAPPRGSSSAPEPPQYRSDGRAVTGPGAAPDPRR